MQSLIGLHFHPSGERKTKEQIKKKYKDKKKEYKKEEKYTEGKFGHNQLIMQQKKNKLAETINLNNHKRRKITIG